jgi:polyisoprenoid-binding protein YceI
VTGSRLSLPVNDSPPRGIFIAEGGISMNLLVLVLAATLYHVEPVNGTVSFSIMKWGVIREEGSFRDFKADIQYDARNAAQSRVSFDVKVESIDTKNNNRDGTLRSEDFLHVRKYPTMTFRSVKVVPRGQNLADVTGDLTIRGITKRITVPVRLLGANGKHAGFETSFKIDRRAFGVTGGRWVAGSPGILGNEVEIRIIAGGVKR